MFKQLLERAIKVIDKTISSEKNLKDNFKYSLESLKVDIEQFLT
ncbi:MAG: hypothetical protein SVO01_09405 [Thermotogota bacterium]|nr:hypothetical protein [Thermotogota bacterium]